MGPTYTLGMTNLIGPLQEITEFAHQLLFMDLLPYPFLRRVANHIHQHQQHIHPVHVIVGFATNANIKAMIIISGSYRAHNFQYSCQHAISYACNTYPHA